MTEQENLKSTKWFKKGVAAQDLNQRDQAIKAYSEVLKLTPTHFAATYNLAVLYHEQGKLDIAQETYIESIKHNPDSALAYKGLGDIFFAQKKASQALLSYHQALKVKPNFPEVWYNAGVVEKHLQNLPAAIAAYQHAIKLRPNYTDALAGLSELAQRTANISETVTFLTDIAKHAPLNAPLQLTLAEIFYRNQQPEKALTFILESLKIDKHNGEAFNLLGLIHLQRGETGTARRFLTQARKFSPNSMKIHSNLIYSFLTDPEAKPKDYLQEVSFWWREHGASLAAETVYSHKRSLIPERSLRLAFISGDFYRHSVSYFFLPLISNLPAGIFETFCYSDTYKTDDYTTRIQKHTDHWHSTYGLDDSVVAKIIANDKIDILIELSGHTANNRLAVIARQPAPIQFSWLGYPASTGISNDTFRLSDKITDPPAYKNHYTETLTYLAPLFLCYDPPPKAKSLPISKAHRSGKRIVFASFNNSAKINRRVINLWAKILKRLPDAILIFKTRTLKDDSVRAFIKKSFTSEDVNPERIIIYGNDFSVADHFSSYNEVDIALDPFPYNGTTTTCDALWMGTPVITLQGKTHAARVGTTLLQALGCPELIATDEADYAEKAVSLANDTRRLSQYHNKIRRWMQDSPLMNAAGFAGSFTEVIKKHWEEWRSKRLEILQRLTYEKGEVLGLPSDLTKNLPGNEAALHLLDRAVETNQHLYPFLKLGQQYNNEQQREEAYICFREELSHNADNYTARFALGHILENLGKNDEAACHYRKVLQSNPNMISAAVSLGSLLNRHGHSAEALKILLSARQQAPDDNSVNLQLATAYYHLRHLEEAYNTLCHCLKHDPKQSEIWNNLGYLMAESGQSEKATECYRRALSIDPSCIEAQTNLIWRLTQTCAWQELNKRVKECNYFAPLLSIILQPDPQQNLQHAQTAIHKSDKDYRIIPQPSRSSQPKDAIIKIGYLSSDYQDHPVAHNMLNLFHLHDRSRFHITAYSCGPDDNSDYRNRIRNDCDAFVDLQKMNDQDSAKIIHAEGIHILIDLMGHTRENRLGICACKPAPVQVSYLGYPGTTGAPFIDYLISDELVIPETDKPYYSEKIIYLPNCFMVADRAPIGPRLQRSSCGLPENSFIFCSFNTPFKIEPIMFKTWMEILKTIPQSSLWLREGSDQFKENLRQEARKHGIDPKYLIFAPRVPEKQDHLARLQLADLALDTRVYNGHTTTLDALWAGVPVLTIKGTHFASRVSDSNLNAIGLSEMVTQDLMSYQKMAIDLAQDPEKLKDIRNRLTDNRLTTSLFNTNTTVKNLETAYLEIWRRYLTGKPPFSIKVN